MKTECKGLFFRGHNCSYVTESKSQTVIGQKIFLTSLKKRSCPGCETCHMMEGEVASFGLNLSNIENKALYKLIRVNNRIKAIKVFEE